MLQLLRTKISIPPIRSKQVDRSRLLECLDDGRQRAATLVVAPAGFGKTTLVASWAQTAPLPVTWLSLEATDRAPERFLNYFIHSIQQIVPDAGTTALAILRSGQALPEQGVLYSLINDFTEIPQDFVLVLDDYHAVDSPEIAKIIQFLIEHRSKNFHLFIVSRTKPDLNLARLRGLDQLMELSATDLRFNGDEIRAFLKQVMDINLTPDELARLNQSTEGWAVGLQLAAIAMNRQPVDWQVPAGQMLVFDYLAEEVFRQEPPQVQDFLMRTALFDQFCAPLCEALFEGGYPVSDLLDYMDKSNLFLIPLDTSRTWFRYHALFAEFLRQQLTRQSPDIVPSLYKKAGFWAEKNGLFDDAIHYAIHAGDDDRAADLIESTYIDLLQRGEQSALLEWLSDLRPGLLAQRPRLLLAKGWGSIVALHAEEAMLCASQAEALIPAAERGGRLRGELIALRVLTGIFQGQVAATNEITEAFVLLSEEDDFLHSVLHFNLGLNSVLTGETQKAVEALNETVQLTRKLNNPLVTIVALTQLGESHQVRGELVLAERVFQQAIQYARETLGPHSMLLGMPYVSYADLLREQNRFEEAIRYGEQGIAYCRVWQPMASMDGYLALARLETGRRNWQAAFERFDQAIQTAERTSTFLDDTFVTVFRTRSYLLKGDLPQALQWMKIFQTRESGDSFYTLREMIQLVSLRARLMRGEDIIGELEKILPETVRLERVTSQIEALKLSAYALHNEGKHGEVIDHLSSALSKGAQGGYVRIFADEGQPLLDLLEEYQDRLDVPPKYLQDILGTMRREAAALLPTKAHPDSGIDLVPLTRRELDVLHLLATGKSNQEIAGELVLALNTVKKHVANILGKLGVSNRTQAAMAAKEKGWID